MLWKNVLTSWENGIYKNYPKNKKHTFIWRTSKLSSNMLDNFNEEYIRCDILDTKCDFSAYKNIINNNKYNNKYTIHFWNLNGDTLLIIPMPRKGKNFASMKQFTDNASNLHKKEFWKYASHIIKRELKKGYSLYISTHGKGVPYFHLRISTYPKYYYNSKLL